jgi:hypothetical protein
MFSRGSKEGRLRQAYVDVCGTRPRFALQEHFVDLFLFVVVALVGCLLFWVFFFLSFTRR